MAALRKTLRSALIIALSVVTMTQVAYAADYLGPTSRSSKYNSTPTSFGVQECSSLLITDDSGERVVQLCHAPVNLDSRGTFEPGSSAGSGGFSGSSATVTN